MTKIHKSHTVIQSDARPVICPLTDSRQADPQRNLAGVHALKLEPDHHLAEHRTAAERLIEQAGVRAAEILSDAHQQAVEIERDAFAHGYASGIQKAEQDYAGKVQSLQTDYLTTITQLEKRVTRQVADLEPQLVELSLSIAEKILSIELKRDDRAFLALVQSALTRLKASTEVQIRVHAEELARVTAFLETHTGSADSRMSCKTDVSLAPGSLILESDAGMVDASIPLQLRKVRQQLQAVQA